LWLEELLIPLCFAFRVGLNKTTRNRMSDTLNTNQLATDSKQETRRRFLKRGLIGACVGGVASLGYAWRLEPHWIDIVHRKMPIKNLPKRLIGKTLIQISDLHIGPVVNDEYIIGAMKIVNELKPDILALTGDLVSYRSKKQYDQAAHVLSHLETAPIAQVAIMGNHEYGYGPGWNNMKVANGVQDVLEKAGFTVLRNRSADFSGFRIIGVDDFWGPNCQLEKSLDLFDPSIANLVLCHNPDAVDREGWNGYEGWVLSGHTHGGQCRLPGLTPPILPVKNKLYAAGQVAIPDGRTLYVNRGLGYLRRVRFCARPEITVFTLS
jgi:uncharacterized protein